MRGQHDRKCAVPYHVIFVASIERAKCGNSCIVDEDIDAAEMSGDFFYIQLDCIMIGNVKRAGQCRPASRANFCHHCLASGGIKIAHGNLGAFRCK